MKILRDPLVVFLLIGAGIFLLYSKVSPDEPEELDNPYRIEITEQIQEVLKAEWQARWNRPASEKEFKGLVDGYVREEILFREATKLGLDQSDTIIRRRLAQKMEFLTSDIADMEEVSDDKLQVYLDEHADRYHLETEVGFEHLFFSPEKRDDPAADARQTLTGLKDGSMAVDAAREQADRTLLSPRFATTALSQIGRQFGTSFSSSIAEAKTDDWFGPVESSYGLHLVRVIESNPGGLPSLDTIRDKVLGDYRYDQRVKLNQQMLDELLKQYEVDVQETSPGGEAS